MPNNSPSQGEDNALLGYSAQYQVAAELTLRALKANDFQKLVLKDPNAGAIDDIQIHTADAINIYQVKWSDPPSTFTKGNFEQFLRDLYDGWARVGAMNPNRIVIAHLYTCSISTRSPIVKSETGGLAKFINDYWNAKKPANNSAYLKYAETLRNQLCATVEVFESFRQQCHFELGRRLHQRSEGYDSGSQFSKDLRALSEALLRSSGERQGLLEFSRDEILTLVNWQGRLDFKSKHDFATPKFYQPIQRSVSSLQEVIAGHNQGYISLLGTPGSGKSTLLTKTLLYSNDARLIRYYCFIPDDPTLQARGEAYNFLHDLTLSLEKEGVTVDRDVRGETIEQLILYFQAQLVSLGQEFVDTGRKTIILIDGIDHVARESNANRSFLQYLPKPPAVPPGVLFVLGSQRLDETGLPAAIIAQARIENRTVTMTSMDRATIRKVVSQAVNCMFEEQDFENIEKLSGGHPLALNYIINQLKDRQNQSVSDLLTAVPPYSQNIENQYESYWTEIGDDDELKSLFALISRTRGAVDEKTIDKMSSQPVIKRLAQKYRHYFVKSASGKWRFFHNSFRQFILDKTGRNAFDNADRTVDRKFHEYLAQIALNSPQPFKNDFIYHAFMSDDYESVLKTAEQNYFRRQYFHLRPSADILSDMSLVVRAAAARGDRLVVTRMLLLRAEIDARDYILEDIDVPDLLVRARLFDEASLYIVRDGRLFADQEKALNAGLTLFNAGHTTEAREVFEAAEPIDKLSGMVSTDYKDEEMLAAWIRLATKFRTVEEIKHAVINLRVQDPYRDTDEAQYTQSMRNFLIHQFCTTSNLDADEIVEIFSDVCTEADIRFWILLAGLESDDDSVKSEAINQLSANNGNKLPPWALMRCVGYYSRTGQIDKAAAVLDESPRPPVVGIYDRETKGKRAHIYRFQYYRAAASIGRKFDIELEVPESNEKREKGARRVQRMFTKLGILAGAGIAGKKLEPSAFLREVLPAILMYEGFRDNNDPDYSYAFAGVVKDYLHAITIAAEMHGLPAVQQLSDFFDDRWTDPYYAEKWLPTVKRWILTFLHEAGGPREDLLKKLHLLRPGDCIGDAAEIRDEFVEHITALAGAQEYEQAANLVFGLIEQSHGIFHEKDAQISDWTDFYCAFLRADFSTAVGDLSFMISGIVSASDNNRKMSGDAGEKLLATISQMSPQYARSLRNMLWDQSTLDFERVVDANVKTGFTDSAIDFAVPFYLLLHFSIPYNGHGVSDGIEEMCIRLAQLDGESAEKYIYELIACVKVEVPLKQQPRWWSAIHRHLLSHTHNHSEVVKLVATLANDKPARLDYTPTSLLLKDGQEITEDEVIATCRTSSGLLRLARSWDSSKSFYWKKFVEPHIPSMSKSDLSELFALLKDHDWRVSLDIAGQLLANNPEPAIIAYIEGLLADSKPYGWSKYFDGGSRIGPFMALINHDPDVRDRAFNQFCSDYLSGNRPSHLSAAFEDLQSIFWKTVPYPALWEELKEHLYYLAEFRTANIGVPASDALVTSTDSPLVDLLFYMLDWFQTEPKQDAFRAIVRIYKDSSNTQAEIRSRLQVMVQVPKHRSVALALLERLSLDDESLVSLVITAKNELLADLDVYVRLLAYRILSRVDINVGISARRDLPAIYTMELPPFKTQRDGLQASALEGCVLPITNDPLQLSASAMDALERISMLTKIGLRNLIERHVTLMKTVRPGEDWDAAAERALLSRCRAMSIELPYRRPRAFVARIALGYLIAELLDANVLSLDGVIDLEPSITLTDLAALQYEETSEPLLRSQITIIDDFSTRTEEWLNTEPNLPQAPFELNGEIVLGFYTRAECPSWSVPTETIIGAIAPPGSDRLDYDGDPLKIIAGTMLSTWWLVSQYPQLDSVSMSLAIDDSIVIKALNSHIDYTDDLWMALNPLIGEGMGWTPDAQLRLDWRDENGEIAIRSVKWRCGRIGRRPPQDGVRAEGWAVVATPSAYARLLPRLGDCVWMTGVSKEFSEENSKPSRKFMSQHRILPAPV